MEKVKENLEKAKIIKNKFEIVPASSLKHCFKFLMEAINEIMNVASNGYISNIERDYLLIDNNKVLKRMRDQRELIDMYFYLRSLINRNYLKVSRRTIRTDGWKSSSYITKEFIGSLIERVEQIVRDNFKD